MLVGAAISFPPFMRVALSAPAIATGRCRRRWDDAWPNGGVMEAGGIGSVRASYDRLAAEYSTRLFHELDGKPIDRALLDEIAARPAGRSVISAAGLDTRLAI
jgi:hypothetical protein